MRILGSRRYRSGSRWCAWRWTDVVKRGACYLTRLHLVQTPGFSVMLHWIHFPDPDEDLHDHPVGFVSLVLRGGYVEQRGGGAASTMTLRNVRWANVVRSTDAHRVVWVAPGTLTLVFSGPVVRSWGYHTVKGFVPWRQYQK